MTTAANASTNHSPSARHIHVTQHYHDSNSHVFHTERDQLSQLENHLRRCRVHLMGKTPHFVLVSGGPPSEKAMKTLPTLLDFLQSLHGIFVAVDQALKPAVPPQFHVLAGNMTRRVLIWCCIPVEMDLSLKCYQLTFRPLCVQLYRLI